MKTIQKQIRAATKAMFDAIDLENAVSTVVNNHHGRNRYSDECYADKNAVREYFEAARAVCKKSDVCAPKPTESQCVMIDHIKKLMNGDGKQAMEW